MRRPWLWPVFIVAFFMAAPCVRAYVTSADLEYSVDDVAAFYLNGKVVLARSGMHWCDYAVLSTSDGTLPLQDFNFNGDNLLAVEDIDTAGYNMDISYRLTVHQSQGDPVVIWSMPNQTKFLHLSVQQADPAGWYDPSFDDSAWQTAVAATLNNQYITWAMLPDPAFNGLLGMQGYVPHVSHRADGTDNTADHNLLRSHFHFPYSPAKTLLLANPPQAVRGQDVAFRLVPAADSTWIGDFAVFADLPRGLQVVKSGQGARFDAKTGQISWAYPATDVRVQYMTLAAASVLNASGWQNPQKVLGPEKPNKLTGNNYLNIPESIFQDGASFFPSRAGWFKLAQPDDQIQKDYPVVLAVIFHSQLYVPAHDTAYTKAANPIYFNFSVDSIGTKVLKKDAWVSRTSGNDSWLDGYYDATEDLHWTWADVNNLRVLYYSIQHGAASQDRMASCEAVVKCYNPYSISPYFMAQVTDGGCDTLKVEAGISSTHFAMVGSDPVSIPVNQSQCAPPTPIPTVVVYIPTPGEPSPTPTPSGPKPGHAVLGLGCLSSSPEPFREGGVFVYLCLKQAAHVVLNVYGAGGSLARTVDGGEFRPGNSQIFFNGLDSSSQPLQPGSYEYALTAFTQDYQDTAHAQFTKEASELSQ